MANAPYIGQLRSRLQFLKDTKTSDGAGGFTSAKSVDFEMWGYIRQISESEAMRNGQVVGYNSYEIWVQYQSSIIPTRQHIILYNNKAYTINGTREIEEKNRWIVMSCSRYSGSEVAVIERTPVVVSMGWKPTYIEIVFNYSMCNPAPFFADFSVILQVGGGPISLLNINSVAFGTTDSSYRLYGTFTTNTMKVSIAKGNIKANLNVIPGYTNDTLLESVTDYVVPAL